jgi:hypothetical protein
VPAARELLQQCSVQGTSAARWADHRWSSERDNIPPRLRDFIPDASSPTGFGLPRKAWVRLNRLRTGVGRFRSSMHRWGLAANAACECGAENQTADHIISSCPIYRAPDGTHGLSVLDDESVTWLLETCPDI